MSKHCIDDVDPNNLKRIWVELTNAVEQWPAEWYSPNMTAQLAMGGMYPDAVGILVRLLRSDTPLHPVLRLVLADAIEGTRPEGTLNFKAGGIPKHGRYSPDARATLRRHIEIAEFMKDSGLNRTNAEKTAANKFAISLAVANKLTDGYKDMMKWVDEVELRRGEHELALAKAFEEAGAPELAEQARARAKEEREAPRMTPAQRRTFCLNTYAEPLVKAKGKSNVKRAPTAT